MQPGPCVIQSQNPWATHPGKDADESSQVPLPVQEFDILDKAKNWHEKFKAERAKDDDINMEADDDATEDVFDFKEVHDGSFGEKLRNGYYSPI